MIPMTSKKRTLSCFVAMCLVLAIGHTVVAETGKVDVNREQPSPAEVFLEMKGAEHLIDEIGLFMGVLKPDALRIKVSDAGPQDVCFQARTLAIKANRLLFEISRKKAKRPPFPEKKIDPAFAKKMFLSATRSLIEVSDELGLVTLAPQYRISKEITPTTILEETITVSRHLNALLERQFAPAEVYRVVNLAIAYAARFLAQFPQAERIPKKPLYEKNKRPFDVYFRLHTCLLLINKIYEHNVLNTITVDITGIREKDVRPSDVYDMASTIVARMDYLHKIQNIRRAPQETYHPGRKVPSDVYQQTGILEQQLKSMLSYVEMKVRKQEK